LQVVNKDSNYEKLFGSGLSGLGTYIPSTGEPEHVFLNTGITTMNLIDSSMMPTVFAALCMSFGQVSS